MGTQPEEIEHALRGKPTLPRPGEPAKVKKEPPEPRLEPDEERRFMLRGGRFNAARPKDEDDDLA